MRRFFLGMAIASLTAGAPLTAFGGDREIADAIIIAVKKSQVSLSGLEVDLTVENGNVVITGTAASQTQLDAVLNAARAADGVKSVDNKASAKVQPPSTDPEVPASPTSTPHSAPVNNPTPAANVVPASASEPSLIIEEASVSSPSDSDITAEILGKLGEAKRGGQLRNFDLHVTTLEGEVTVRGSVASEQQKSLVLGKAQRANGVIRVVDDVTVVSVRTVSSEVPGNLIQPPLAPIVPAPATSGAPRAFAASTINNIPVQVAPVQSAPVQIPPVQVAPVQTTPAQVAQIQTAPIQGVPVSSGVMAPQAPVPMNAGPSYGAGVPRYDSPYMPGYAWPSYAAYPNYAAVTYPKQYSASAWPYIGPFYPYPQVPLGWRRVSLEWDDGLWYLDFTHK